MSIACLYVRLYLAACHLGSQSASHSGPSAAAVQGWITAMATGVLAAGAIFTVIYAIKAFRTQAKELAILIDERRRAQAARVFIGVVPDPVRLVAPYAKNASDFPVFDAQFWHPWPGRLSGPEDLGMIMPHEQASISPRFNREDAITHTILTFRDAEGVRWIRMPDGTYDEQARPTPEESVRAALGLPPTDAS